MRALLVSTTSCTRLRVCFVRRLCRSVHCVVALQYITTGALKGFMTNLANAVHHISLAFLAGISAKSFDNIVDAAKRNENVLPHLMLALARLSIVLSQFSAMAMATAVITVVGAAAQWPWIGLFLSMAMAASMLLRMGASLFLMTEFGGRGSVVSLVASLQSKSGRASPRQGT